MDLEKRLRRTFSNMAASESLTGVLDGGIALQMLQWGEGLARQFVLKTSEMDDVTAAEYLAPYFSALRRMMRAIGHVSVAKDDTAQLEWWNLVEQNGKTLYGDSFILPDLKNVQPQLATFTNPAQKIAYIQNMVEEQKARG